MYEYRSRELINLSRIVEYLESPEGMAYIADMRKRMGYTNRFVDPDATVAWVSEGVGEEFL